MARTPVAPTPVSPIQTPERARKAVERLRSRIAELEAFDPSTIRDRRDASIEALESQIGSTLEWVFGARTPAYMRFSSASTLDTAGYNMVRETPLYEVVAGLGRGKARAIELLKAAIVTITEEVDEVDPPQVQLLEIHKSRKIFVVHGRNAEPREAVARVLVDLKFEPIILHERPNKGRTIITKFREEADDAGFAIVLLTPDDVGGLQGGGQLPRARQNVVFELGYFIGKLGADRVVAIVLGDVERPSDFEGVVYIDYDARGAWKMDLGKELDAAGYQVDFGILIRR